MESPEKNKDPPPCLSSATKGTATYTPLPASSKRFRIHARPSVLLGLQALLVHRFCWSRRDWSSRRLTSVPQTDNRIRLGAFLALDDIELNVIALFQRFISVQLNRRVMDEYIRSVFTSNEAVPLGVVEPLDLPFVLSHRFLPSLHPVRCGGH